MARPATAKGMETSFDLFTGDEKSQAPRPAKPMDLAVPTEVGKQRTQFGRSPTTVSSQGTGCNPPFPGTLLPPPQFP